MASFRIPPSSNPMNQPPLGPAGPQSPLPVGITIRESFYQSLPQGRHAAGLPTYHDTHDTSATDGQHFPPNVAISVPLGKWLSLADEILQYPNTTPWHIDHAYLPTWEGESRVFRTEEDVVSAATCQLLNPVDLTFKWFHHQYPFALLSEHNASRNGQYSHARVDRAWCLEQNYERPFVLLEAKCVRTLQPREFEAAISAGEEALRTDSPVDYETSYFTYNSFKLMAQAVKYKKKFRTPYIAIFDWDCLILAVMDDDHKDHPDLFCRLTIVSDPSLMRRALLGFVHGAFRAVLAKRSIFPPLIPGFKVTNMPSQKSHPNPRQSRVTKSGRSVQSPARLGQDQYSTHGSSSSRRDDLGFSDLSLEDSHYSTSSRNRDVYDRSHRASLEPRSERRPGPRSYEQRSSKVNYDRDGGYYYDTRR